MGKIVGCLDEEIIKNLNLNIAASTPIYLGDMQITHIKNRHPYEYECYFDKIEEIIKFPDYYGMNRKDGSIMLIKDYEVSGNIIRIGIKLTNNGKLYMKTLHLLSTCNFQRFLEKGTIKRLTKKME